MPVEWLISKKYAEKIIFGVHETCAKNLRRWSLWASTRQSIRTNSLLAQFGGIYPFSVAPGASDRLQSLEDLIDEAATQGEKSYSGRYKSSGRTSQTTFARVAAARSTNRRNAVRHR